VARRVRIGLLTTLGTNIGDDLIREGLIHLLRRLIPAAALKFTIVNKHRPHSVYPSWHPARARSLCGCASFRFTRFDRCDVIVQCGTPVLWHGCRASEWAGPIWRDVLHRLALQGMPILNLGAGSCYPWERRPTGLAGDPDEPFVRLMLQTACVTTARDRLMSDLCGSVGYEIRPIPCPAFLAGQAYVSPAAPTRKVVVNFMAGGGHYDWGQNIDAAQWRETMREVVDRLARKGWQPWFIAHNAAELELAAQLWSRYPRFCTTRPSEYFAAVRDAAFGVVNRMHAAVAAAGLGIPSIAIGTDTRTLMIEALGLPSLYVKDATAERILDIAGQLAANRGDEFGRLLALRERTVTDYENCLRPFLPPALAATVH